MSGSLRGRLLLWHTGMLVVVIVVFGSMVCYLAWRSRLADVDEVLRTRAEALSRRLQPVGAGTFDLTLPPDSAGEPGASSYYVLWTSAGTLIDRSDSEIDVPPPRGQGVHTRDQRRELTVRAASGAYVLVGMALDEVRAAILQLAAIMAAVGLTVIGISFVSGWYLVGRALTPVTRINRTARAMIDGDFAARIAIDRVDTELGQLARALNEAFDRLHAALERQRRFTADASHELRTPIATMSTEADWALCRDRTPDEYRGSLDVCRRAAARMHNVVERLLALARAEGPEESRAVPIELHALAEDVARDLRPLSDARHLDVSVKTTPATCVGDPDRIQDAVTNVIVNAIQYNVPGGRIRIEVRQTDDHAELVVEDTGVGISADHLPHVFEPFFRADPARSRAVGGAGLGLAVARAAIGRAGGDVLCASEPGRGTTVTVRLRRRSRGTTC
ncbi:MAG: HAMP domain-containing histidine kinase [Acidobacteria bacterium]|nr:HAMP domain-containing histidine kinase [Acidobacteriota bacterium]